MNVRILDCNPERDKYCVKVRFTIKIVKVEDLGLWYVGFDQVSVDTLVPFRVEDVRAGDSSIVSQNTSRAPDKTDTDSGVVKSHGPGRIAQTKDLKEVIEVETGYGYTARSVAKE